MDSEQNGRKLVNLLRPTILSLSLKLNSIVRLLIEVFPLLATLSTDKIETAMVVELPLI